MNNGQRFAALFRGYEKRYGRYDITSETVAEEKVAGKARTVDQEITLDDYASHVEGGVGIGVIPLREDSKINFAAIDIDVYNQQEQKARNLTHADIALALMETPLIVTQSKSGGIHVWLFASTPVSAKLATDYLKAQAAHLGVAGCEVFPKQTERHSDEDVGNWINLPYYGGKRVAVIPSKSGSVVEYIEPELELFLDIAEGAAKTVTEDFLIENTKLPSTQRGTGEHTELWFDGPPCLQTLLNGHPEKVAGIKKKFDTGAITEEQFKKQMAFTTPQLGEGARNWCFFNVGLYLRRRQNEHDPDAALDKDDQVLLKKSLKEVHEEWRVITGDKGIGPELDTIAKQASKGKWGYKCTDEPLKGHCNRRLCLQRKFGVGTGSSDSAFAISGFTIVDTEDKQYYMNVGDKRVYVPDIGCLLNQSEFGKIVANAIDRVWVTMADPKFKQMMDGLLEKADHIEGPPDSDRRAVILNALREFVHDKSIEWGKSESAIFNGRAVWTEDASEAWFKFDQFTEFLRGKGIQMGNNKVADMLKNDLGVTYRGNTHIGNRQVRPYVVDLKHLDSLMGDEHGEA